MQWVTRHVVLVDSSQTRNINVAGHTGKCAKCSETLMRACKFDSKDQNTILQFLEQLIRACNSNGIARAMVLWSITSSLKDGSASVLTVWITSLKDNRTFSRLSKAGHDLISSNGKAVAFNLKFYITESKTAYGAPNSLLANDLHGNLDTLCRRPWIEDRTLRKRSHRNTYQKRLYRWLACQRSECKNDVWERRTKRKSLGGCSISSHAAVKNEKMSSIVIASVQPLWLQ